MNLSDTPRANRLHIGIFGKRNSGKSTLINALTQQETAIVSEVAGTTTDPVYKSMEIHGIGPCVFIDTAGFDDDAGKLGKMRVEKTKKAVEKTDIALVVLNDGKMLREIEWINKLKKENIPVIPILNKMDRALNTQDVIHRIECECGLTPIEVSAKYNTGIEKIKEEIIRIIPEDYDSKSITGTLVKEGDLILLVTPQDLQAPKGRLILPQVQTIRDLLDKHCIIVSVTMDKFDKAISYMTQPPVLIITDSQIFKQVYSKKPKESRLTSFSALFASYKGDLKHFTESVKAIDKLTENSRVLIAEACTHAPLSEDIGREKIPQMLRQKVGENLKIDMVSGSDFPDDLSQYDLIIHCGACMFNRKYVLSRVRQASTQGVPITNYGIVIAYLAGILDKIYFG